MRPAALALALGLAVPALAAAQTAPAAESEAARINVERRIAQLHEAIGIGAAQEAPWSAFAAVMRANAREMDDMLRARRATFAKMAAPADLQAYADLTAARAAAITRLVPPFRALYAALTPEQRRRADAVFHRFADRPGGVGASLR